MFITRETDYGIRTVRALAFGRRMTLSSICEAEDIPRQFAYKIMKKLESAGIVRIQRGAQGGYEMNGDIDTLTLYDIIKAIDPDLVINRCLNSEFDCTRNGKNTNCLVHNELCRIQLVLENELKSVPFRTLV